MARKPGFHKTFAFFATNYGGMDMRFQLDGSWQESPAGVAHFLEQQDVRYKGRQCPPGAGGQLRLLPIAFTSSALTGYYFESTEKFEENLRVLLSLSFSIPWFTQESVDKEQGIIGQEIQMIEDDPEWQVFTNLLCGPLSEPPHPHLRGREPGVHLPYHCRYPLRLP